jgi:ribosome-associated protein
METTNPPIPADASRPPKSDSGEDFAVAAAHLMTDMHCEEVLIYDVRGLSPLTNFLVIATGTSDRQIKAMARHISELAREQYDLERFGSQRDDASTWLVMDFIDVMLHLFEPATRAHYDLEMMWGDAPQLQWRHDGKPG